MAIDKDRLRASAEKYLQKSQFDKAIAELEQIVAEDSSDIRTLQKIGDLYVRLQKYDQAVQRYLRVAESYEKQGFTLKAVAAYKQILKLEPYLISTQKKLIGLYAQMGLQADAVAQLWLLYELMLQHAEAPQSIVETLKEILLLDPHHLQARLTLATYLEDLEGMSVARNLIQEGLDLSSALNNTENIEPLANQLVAYLHLNPDELGFSIDALMRAKQVERAKTLLEHVCLLYSNSGNRKGLRLTLEALMRLEPNNVKYRQQLHEMNDIDKTMAEVDAFMRLHLPSKAQTLLESALQTYPNQAELLQTLNRVRGHIS